MACGCLPILKPRHSLSSSLTGFLPALDTYQALSHFWPQPLYTLFSLPGKYSPLLSKWQVPTQPTFQIQCYLHKEAFPNYLKLLSIILKLLPWWYSGKESTCNAGDTCRRQGFDPWVGKIPLEKEMATHSSILGWKIPWTEEPGGLQSMGSQKSWTWLSN